MAMIFYKLVGYEVDVVIECHDPCIAIIFKWLGVCISILILLLKLHCRETIQSKVIYI